MEQKQLVNVEQIQMLGGLEHLEVRAILSDCLTTFSEQTALIESLLGAGEASAVREEAHKLKGAAVSCGFDALGQHAEALESRAATGEIAGLEEWPGKANEKVRCTRAELDRLVKLIP